jgi:hypothetical protein
VCERVGGWGEGVLVSATTWGGGASKHNCTMIVHCLQVHLATMNGQQVVVKVQRPGLKELFDIDLKNVRQLVRSWGVRVCVYICVIYVRVCICACESLSQRKSGN